MNALSWTITRESALANEDGYPIMVTERRYNWEAIFGQDTVWITEDGRVLLLSQIEDDHLTKVLPFVLRKTALTEYGEAFPLVQALRLELAKRGL